MIERVQGYRLFLGTCNVDIRDLNDVFLQCCVWESLYFEVFNQTILISENYIDLIDVILLDKFLTVIGNK